MGADSASMWKRGGSPIAVALLVGSIGLFSEPVAHGLTCNHPAGGIPITDFGDLNASGAVNVSDALCSLLVNQAALASQPLSGVSCLAQAPAAADLNCDGVTDVSDVLLCVRLALGMGIPAALSPDAAGCPAACASCSDGGPSCLIDGGCVPEGDRTGDDGCQVCEPAEATGAWTAEPPTAWYLDEDGDGFGVDDDFLLRCTPLGDYRTTAPGDCDDDDPNVHPDAEEQCNGIDDNCDGNIDEGCPVAGSSAGHAPLDDLPGAAAGWSVRRLSVSYTGPALRVRRSSDGAELDLGFTPGGKLDTLALRTFCGGATCTVRTWYDQTGGGRHFQQPTASAQPVLVDSGAIVVRGGHPTLRMQTQWLDTATFDWGASFSVFLVHGLLPGGFGASTGAGSYWRILETQYQNHLYLGASSGTSDYQLIVNNGTAPFGSHLSPVEATDALRLHAVTVDGGSALWRIDGAIAASPSITPITSSAHPLVLNRWPSGGYHANGYYSELIWYDAALGAGDREHLEASQACAFGIHAPSLDSNGDGVPDACENVVDTHCTALREAGHVTSGVYTIDPDGSGGAPPYRAYCEMDISNGGWTLALNLDTSDGHVMWWANPRWTDGQSYGTVATPLDGDLVSPAWASLSGGTQVLLVIHEQGQVVGWRRFRKVDGQPMLAHLGGGDNTLVGDQSLSAYTSLVWNNEWLVRNSTQLFANHCVQHFGSCTSGSEGSPDGHRLGSHEAAPMNNVGGGLGNWADMALCCGGQSYAGKTCGGQAFRTTSEAQAGWCPSYLAPNNHGYFGTDTFAPATCAMSNLTCGNAAWSAPSGLAYDYAVFVGHQPTALGTSGNPALSCKQILDAGDSTGDGLYWVDPTGAAPTQVFCDMTLDGGGWTYLMPPLSASLGTSYSLGATPSWTNSGPNCLSATTVANPDLGWPYVYAYNCAAFTARAILTWNNTIGATQVRFTAVGGGNSPVIQLNGSSVTTGSSAKNLFHNSSAYTCGLNNCWRTTIAAQAPFIRSFSGNLDLRAGGTGDNHLWGGSGGIWNVAVR